MIKSTDIRYIQQQTLLQTVAADLGARVLFPDYHGEHGDPNTTFLYAANVDDDYFFRFTNTDRSGCIDLELANGGTIVMIDDDWAEKLEWSVRLAHAIWAQNRIHMKDTLSPEEIKRYHAANETIVKAMSHLYGEVFLIRIDTDDEWELYEGVNRREDGSLDTDITRRYEAVVSTPDRRYARLCVMDVDEFESNMSDYYKIKDAALEAIHGVKLCWR